MTSLNLTQVQVDRHLGRASLHAFVRMAFPILEPGAEFVDGRHIGVICDHLMACHRGEIRQLAICIPPGCMKSVITSILFPVWSWLQDSSLAFAVIGYDSDLTGGRDGGKVIKLLESEWFQERWGKDVVMQPEPAKGHIKTTREGFRYATSIGGKYTGRHVHYEIGDDLLNAKTLTKAKIDDLTIFRTRVAPSRTIPWKPGQPGARIYINQRLHESDAVGQAKEEEEKDPGSWTFLELPMYYEQEGACTTTWGKDWRTTEGELLWPQRFTASLVADRQKLLPSKDFSAQYQQKPVPAGGLIFDGDTLTEYFVHAPTRFDELLISVDATFKDAQSSDFVCIGVIGRVGAKYYVLDLDWRRMSFTATLDAIRTMVRTWPRARAKLIEDKANGPAIIDTLKKEIPGIIPVKPEGGKEARANSVEPYFAARNVIFPNPAGAAIQPDKTTDLRRLAWVDRLKSELVNFPLGKHDDGVDMLSQALLYFGKKKSSWMAAMMKIRKDMQKEEETGK